jgi:hypothetical protein
MESPTCRARAGRGLEAQRDLSTILIALRSQVEDEVMPLVWSAIET